MRGIVTVTVLAPFAVVAVLATPQDPSPSQQVPPVFRGEVDLIRLDVSVLERDRRPVTGLRPADFTVIEDGTPQKIAAFTEVVVPAREAKPTAWMRHARPDIVTNDLVDQLGEGRPYAIVMDDWTIPADDLFLVGNARSAGREILARLGSADVGAVVYVHNAGRTVDFTTDRSRLMDAVNGFEGRHPEPAPDSFQTTPSGPLNPRVPRSPAAPWGAGGLPPASGRDAIASPKLECTQERPLVPTLEVTARRLAMVPERRKSIVLITAGNPLWSVRDDWKVFGAQTIGGGRGLIAPGGECASVRASEIRHVYAVAQLANINIYTVDVSDDQRVHVSDSPGGSSVLPSGFRLFLQDIAQYTGGLVVGANGESTATSADRIFAEAGSYYLIGYQSSNGAPDGKFRDIEVKVNRPYVTVRARSGYFPLTAGEQREIQERDLTGSSLSSAFAPLLLSGAELARQPASAASLAASGLYAPAGVPLRVNVAPVGLTPVAGRLDMEIAVALSVRLPPSRASIDETLTVTRQIYDAKGRPGSPVVTTETFAVPSAANDETRYERIQRFTLPPGRHEVRINARSTALGRSGSVFATVDVPDVARAPVALTGIVLGAAAAPDTPRTDVLASVLPIVPTSGRAFATSQAINVFFQVFQSRTAASEPIALRVQVLDRRDQPVVDRTETLAPEAFASGRGVVQHFPLPLADLTSGPHLLSVSATRPNGTTVRRDVPFVVR
jgi:VWFA-related protein